MSTTPARDDTAAQLKRALGLLRDLRARLDSVERARSEPIAIVGMSCRVPGADGTEAFWQLLRDGVDAITETPAERWDSAALYDPDPLAPGKVATRWGGFLSDIDRFDAAFFGIAPREAAQMDPQQRLLLEVAYEALEDAGQPIEELAGTRAGVFVGVHSQSNDYFLLQSADTAGMDLYSGTGTSHSVAAGRLSYLLDFRGPCVAIDTACSSSLVGVHLAVQSLRRGESDLALAGGVNVILDPTFTIAASRMQMLAPDGRCKTFDASADGFVRSEGCGMVVLKRLGDALADGDPVQAVIYGSAINQDGNSNGLTAPNGISQQAVIRDALKDAGITPDRIGYVEAHGTGTSLGDPIEVEALAEVLGAANESGNCCLLGSVKANIGHLEGAAGVAGLIKTVLTLRHGLVPKLPHFTDLNPFITLEGTSLEIPTELRPWPAGDAPRYAGVSSFGWSGTNAHIIVGDPPEAATPPTPPLSAPETAVLLPLSARSEEALRDLASEYADHLRGPDAPALVDVAFTAATRRSQLSERLAVVGTTHEMLTERLAAVASGQPTPGIVRASAAVRPPRLIFVFPGQGGQWLGMGLRLAATEPVFAAALARCAAAIEAETGWSLLDELKASPEQSRLGEIAVVQPAIFAIQVALAELLAEWGLRPDVVVGHSLGEVAAAHVAGILSLEDAAAVICRRSRLLMRVAGRGAMGVVELPLDEATALLAPYDGRLAVAASNGPTTTVLAGEADALDEALAIVQGRGGFARRVQVDVASHSPQVEPLLADLELALADIEPRPTRTGFASTVTGGRVAGPELGAAYWARNLRQPVLFGPVVAELLRDSESAFLELSPHPVLLSAVEGAARVADAPATAVGALRRGQDEAETLREAAGALWAAGVPVDWSRIGPGRVALPLPGYPWQRERFWFTGSGRSARSQLPAPAGGPAAESLLGSPLPELAHLPGSRFWQGRIEPPTEPDAVTVSGVPILPGAAAALMTHAAIAAATGDAVEQLEIEAQPLLTAPLETQTVLTPLEDHVEVRLFTRVGAEEPWTPWATARTTASSSQPDALDISALQARLSRQPEAGPGTLEIWRGETETLARFASPDDDELGRAALLNLASQLLREPADDSGALLAGADLVALHADLGDAVWAYANRRDAETAGDVCLLAADGTVLGELKGVRLCAPDDELLQRASTARLDDWLYAVEWRPGQVADLTTRTDGDWLILADAGGLGTQLAASLEARGARPHILEVPANDPEALARLLHVRIEALQQSCAGVIDLRALDEAGDDLPSAAESYSGSALALAQELARTRFNATPRLWLVTRDAQAVGGPPANPAGAALWGLGRVIANEHPEFWGGLVDLDPAPDEREAEMLCAAIIASGREDELALRGDQCYSARVARHRDLPGTAISLRPDATYLITGGAGGVGLAVARGMVEAGARHLALVGRSPLSPSAAAVVATLESAGATVTYLRGDISRSEDVATIFATLAETSPPLGGIVHGAGVLADATLLQQTPESLHAVLAPKVAGAWNLARAAEGVSLDFMAFFSSASALLGTPGQANYAAANTVLDAYTRGLRSEGIPAVSIAWGRWGDVGLATRADNAASLDRLGIVAMPPAAGVAAFGRVVAADTAYVAVLDINWSTFLTGDRSATPRFADIAPEVATDSLATPADGGTGLRARLEAAAPDQRNELLLEHVRALAAAVLRFDDPLRVLPGQGFFQIGMDSLTAVELKNRLQQSLGLTLPATTAFDYPTPATLARHLLGEMFSDAPAPTTPDTVDDDLNGLSDLSRDELRDLLDAELESINEELVR